MNGLLMKFTSADEERITLLFKNEKYLNLRLRTIHRWWLLNNDCMYLPVWKLHELLSPASKHSGEATVLNYNFFRRQ